MKYFKKIRGGSVYLSPISGEDAEIYVRWMNEPDVANGLGVSGLVISAVYEKNWLETYLKSDKVYCFAIVRQSDDELIGTLEFRDIEHIHGTATIGLFIGDAENRGKGYGTETVRLAVQYGFDVLNLNNINLNVYSFNEAALKSYAKAGFREYGRRSQAFYLNGKYHDIISMEILREEYYKNPLNFK
ncbi:MAG: GNAT family N-acetyltransferase [Oscillospiraceae bacterium]|jgi:RimJ/RimL family protein N-acetyltransferase|nr:GNAT family N-acetyltransferase [Oscillospiraceae bacterium]